MFTASSKQPSPRLSALSSLLIFLTRLFLAWARDGSNVVSGFHEKYPSLSSKITKVILIGLYGDT